MAYSDGRVVSRMPSVASVQQWIHGTVLSPIFEDPSCGDGLCEAPLEYGSIFNDRYGCRVDCGQFPNVSRVVVSFDITDDDYTQINALGIDQVGWNLCWLDEDICFFETPEPFFTQIE